ncbi:hypothetical protein CDD80_6371 [Ophiocordyceps camponoti-rufipedis]|uniref:Zn(2)-C6 fungal-type domain-containing protein n=1 Tax=Ophiocordyceps camponoti-rufipedis TaxID=2004952 RepID=A0A2C5XEX4_9HYPO|nr:hypothetical protein CDD80_6371 [Ophiocordyceps camponoti-rufipedis]
MGRRPNPLILEYFERGPKLNDNSNRYPHTCKQCGENFPKGRIDSLTTHITKRCPAISESERMRACLELHGIAHARPHGQRASRTPAPADGPETLPDTREAKVTPQGWSALETLAEASRQVDLNEHNNRSPNGYGIHDLVNSGGDDRLEIQGQLALNTSSAGCADNVVMTETAMDTMADNAAQTTTVTDDGAPTPIPTTTPPHTLTPEEGLQALIPISEASSDDSNMSVAAAAAAATARLRSSFLDPQLVESEAPATFPSPTADTQTEDRSTSQASSSVSLMAPNESQPWGAMTYVTTTAPSPAISHSPATPAAFPLIRGGVRMETGGTSIYNGRSRHFRSKFTPARRQEVKEVRKLGACIRCRILRKICSRGTPCDTCRKVLSPRVWMSGCVRSRLHEQLDLYSAGVQVVLSQNRINLHKDQLQLIDVHSVVDVSHFPDAGKHISLPTLAVLLDPSDSQEEETTDDNNNNYQVIMVNQDKDDVPGKIELYMRDVLDLFISREPSRFIRVTLETASRLAAETKDDLLHKALELWGLVESIDRERQWTIIEHTPDNPNRPSRPIREAEPDNDVDVYTMICMQLNAAAERKANSTSRNLLNHMDRLLADSKTKVGFAVYLAALIFLNCVEKSTWAFKAWEQHHLRPGWPLERDPGAFTNQGADLAGLLRMLLAIRRALPVTGRAEDGRLVAMEQDAVLVDFFDSLDLNYSRSLELTLCSHLILPAPTS